MGSVLCKLFYTILLSHKSGIVNTVFRFVSYRKTDVRTPNQNSLLHMEIYFQEMNYTLNLLFLLNNQV